MKTKNISILLILACISLFSYSCSFLGNCVDGEGKIIEKTLQLDKFSKIELSGSTKVYIKEGNTQSVRIKAQSNLIELLNTAIIDGEWDIQFSECIKTKETIEIYIVIPLVEKLEIKGSGEIISDGTLSNDKLELEIKGSGEMELIINAKDLISKIAGSGDLKLKGETEKHSISIKGSGDIKAYELISNETEVSIKGSGDVKINTNESLEVEIFGSGDVSYKGNAQKVNSNIKGSGDLNRIN